MPFYFMTKGANPKYDSTERTSMPPEVTSQARDVKKLGGGVNDNRQGIT